MPIPATVANTTPQAIIDLWFSPRVRPLWFRSTAAFDAELREHYAGLVAAAIKHELLHWEATPPGALALVILLDQFPLNMYRGQAQGFAGEREALAVADRAIARGFDAVLSDEQKGFLYMPFMHSETLADQERSVALFTRAGLDNSLKWASHHCELVRRFGRFPHRNAIFGRQNTADETAYLQSAEAFRG